MTARLEELIARISADYKAEPHYLAAIRIAYGLWVILFPVDLAWVTRVPNEFFHPRPGPFMFLNQAPGQPVLFLLTVTTMILGLLLVIGIRTLLVSALLSLALITSSGILYSYSKVNHMILFEIAPIFLALAGWGTRWSADDLLRRRSGAPVRPVRGMPVLLFAMTVGWGLLSAAAPKIKGGWLDPEREASRGYLAREIVRGNRLGPLGRQAIDLDNSVLWKFLDYATVLAEGGLIFAVLTPVVFRVWLILLASFHVGVYLTLGINFAEIALVYAVFFSPYVVWVWDRFSNEFTARARRSAPT